MATLGYGAWPGKPSFGLSCGAGQGRLVAQQAGGNYFQGRQPFHQDMLSLVDLAHAAGAETWKLVSTPSATRPSAHDRPSSGEPAGTSSRLSTFWLESSRLARRAARNSSTVAPCGTEAVCD